ncbi:MAG: SDR family oxidoreductase [Propionibacteriaceae bacterium]|nr:SDR family oxidoreductase [Propionibacteriaceae bacterium]
MKVLLTGHQGYLGSVMAPVLRRDGHEVTGLDVGWFADCLLGPAPDDPPGLGVDLRDVTAQQLEGFDAVIHLAALSNDPLGNLAPGITYDINHHAAVRLAEVAKQAGVARFLYSSTCSVYGAAGDGLVAEDAELAPVTPYAVSKVRVEAELDDLADESFCPVSLRNATAFGFSPRLRADIVLNNLVGHALLTGEVLVLSDGTPWRPLVHAADIAEVFAAVLVAPAQRVRGVKINVGSEANNVTVAEIAEVVAAETGAAVRITGEAGNDPRSYRVDFSLLRRTLPGLGEFRSIADGARELVAAYREHGMTRQRFEQDFVRLARIRELRQANLLDDDLRAAP